MGLLARASRLGIAGAEGEAPRPIEIAETLTAALRYSARHADYPGEVFKAFKTLIGFRKGALLLRSEHDDVYEPWITEGFNRTTARRLRIAKDFPVLVGNGDSRFVEVDPADLAPVLSNSEFGPLVDPKLLILGSKREPAALILMADMSGNGQMQGEMLRGIQFMNDKLSPGIPESRELMRVADDEADPTWSEWLENWDRDEAVLVVVDATNAIDAVVEAVPGLELYRARKDVVGIIRHITGRVGRVFDLKDGRFVVLFPPDRVPDRDLFFRQLSQGVSDAYETLKVRPEFPAHYLHWPTDREALNEHLAFA